MLERIKKTASFIRDSVAGVTGGTFAEPEIGIILGTGLGGLVDSIEITAAIAYGDIPDFPVSTVQGHSGRLIFGLLGGKRVVAMQGRFHYYEGWEPWQVVFPVRVMKFLGIRTLFVSNASGGINPSFHVGDIMVITDHVNLIPNPLIGPNIEALGPRFPDMHGCYDPKLREIAAQVAAKEGIELQYGVYVGGTGPTFETQAEYKYFKAIGGDAAGMSTTPEVIAARHLGIPVFGASVITNVGLSDEAGDHEDVQKQGAAAGIKMTVLFTEIIKQL
jgi:purine-nucleoside phosphorylase